MARINTPIVELRFKNKTTTITDKVRRLKFKQSVLLGEYAINLELESPEADEFESLMFSDAVWEIRISNQVDGLVERTSGWLPVLVIKSTFQFEGRAPVVSIKFGCLSEWLKAKQHIRAYSNMDFVRIVKRIARKYNLAVLDTPETRIDTWYQVRETDWDFLQRVARDNIVQSGHANIFPYFEKWQMRLYSFDFTKPVVREYKLGLGDDRTERGFFTNYFREADYLGAGKISVTGFDLEKKLLLEINPIEILPILASKLPRRYTDSFKTYHTAIDTLAVLKQKGQRLWSESARRYFSGELLVNGDIDLRLGDMISVTGVDPYGNYTSFNGKYPVYELLHTFDGVANIPFTTAIGCFRRTFLYGVIAAGGANLSRISSKDTYKLNQKLIEPTTVLMAEELK